MGDYLDIIHMNKPYRKKIFGDIPNISYLYYMKVIYQIKNLLNGKLYIGSTKNFKRRKTSHIKKLNARNSGCTGIQNAWNKYGQENFIFEILEEVPDEVDMIYREEQLILLHNTNGINGYNIQLPYTMGSRETSYDKTKHGLKDWFSKNAPHGLKKMTSEEWLKKRNEDSNFTLRSIKKEKLLSSLSKSVIAVDMNGGILEEFQSIGEAAKKYYGDSENRQISICCKNNSKYIKIYKRKGLIWFFKKDFDLNKFKELIKSKEKIIIPYSERNLLRNPISLENINTGEIKDFKSRIECSDFLGCAKDSLQCLIRGFKNKGKGKTVEVTNIKGWKVNRKYS